MKNQKLLTIVQAAMLAALCCVATMIIRVPTIGTNGYVNIGDSIVLISAWLLGNPYGALAAGIGSALADLLAGYASYVPGTLVIKFAMAFFAALVYSIVSKTRLGKIPAFIISSVVAEVIMILGYFLYESTFLGYGLAAAGSIGSNAIQGITCLVIGNVLINILLGTKYIRNMFSKENKEDK